MSTLTNHQLAALKAFEIRAQARSEAAKKNLKHMLEMSDLSQDLLSKLVRTIIDERSVSLHFHPDRWTESGQMIVESLIATGEYRSQFQTGVSAGSVSAHKGGFRYQWEDRLFDGAYNEAPAEERPKYGALSLLQAPDGPAPRFGSCYLVLKPEVTKRCSFTYMDSHTAPKEQGTADVFEDVLAALLREAFEREYALGFHEMSMARLVDELLQSHDRGPGVGKPSRNLDHYIEAQVHGTVDLERDGLALVADPSFEKHPVGSLLRALARVSKLPLHWHGGFELPVKDVPKNFRGPTMPRIAESVAGEGGVIDARLIGMRAQGCLGDEVLTQELKRLWHVLVKFGRWKQATNS